MDQSLVLNRPKVFLQKPLFSLLSFHMRCTHPLGPESELVIPTWSGFLHRSAQVDAIILSNLHRGSDFILCSQMVIEKETEYGTQNLKVCPKHARTFCDFICSLLPHSLSNLSAL